MKSCLEKIVLFKHATFHFKNIFSLKCLSLSKSTGTRKTLAFSLPIVERQMIVLDEVNSIMVIEHCLHCLLFDFSKIGFTKTIQKQLNNKEKQRFTFQ
jgi:hypothetical protein